MKSKTLNDICQKIFVEDSKQASAVSAEMAKVLQQLAALYQKKAQAEAQPAQAQPAANKTAPAQTAPVAPASVSTKEKASTRKRKSKKQKTSVEDNINLMDNSEE